MTTTKCFLVAAVSLALFASLAAAEKEWMRPGIGTTLTAVHASVFGRGALFVGSAKGVVARLSIADGHDEWRAALQTQSERITGLVVDTKAGIVLARVEHAQASASEPQAGWRVRALNISTGSYLWERPAHDVSHVRGCYTHIQTEDDNASEPNTYNAVTGALVNLDDDGQCAASSGAPKAVELVRDTRKDSVWQLGRGLRLSVDAYGTMKLASGDPLTSTGWLRDEGIAHAIAGGFFQYGLTKGHETQRVLIVLSELGALYGLNADVSGRVEWSNKFLDQLPTCENDDLTLKLLSGHTTQAVVVAVCPSTQTTSVLSVDATRGITTRNDTLTPFVAIHGFVQSEHGPATVRLVDADGYEKVVGPPNAEASSDELSERRWMFTSIGGTALEGRAGGKVVWRVPIPSGSQIVALATAESPDPFVHPSTRPAVRTTGKRGILKKLVDPAYALVLTEREADAKRNHSVTSMMINTRTGAVLEVVSHEHGVGPVQAVRSDNWFVYSFWNSDIMEQEVHVIDIFDGSPRKPWIRDALLQYVREMVPMFVNGGPRGATDVAELSREDSAVALAHPRVYRSSFLSTHRIVSLSTTKTERGTTERALLVGLSSGRVLYVSRLFLDPRRPNRQSKAASAELLSKYSPLMNLYPAQAGPVYFFKGGEVLRLLHDGGLVASPVARRESSCHLACIGTDIRYTVVTPGGKYDCLSEDFSYGGVLSSVVVLILASAVARRQAKNKALNEEWLA